MRIFFSLLSILVFTHHIVALSDANNVSELSNYFTTTSHQMSAFAEDADDKTRSSEQLLREIKDYKGWYSNRLHWIHSPIFSQEQKLEYLKTYQRLAGKINNNELWAWASLNKSKVNFQKGLYNKSMEEILDAYRIYLKSKNIMGLSSTFFALAEIYEKAGMYTTAIKYYTLSNDYLKSNNPIVNERRFINNNHIAKCTMYTGKYQESIDLLRLSYSNIPEDLPKENLLPAQNYIMLLICENYLLDNKPDDALMVLNKVSNLQRKHRVLNSKRNHILSKIEYQKKNYNKALECSRKAFLHYSRTGNVSNHNELLMTISKCYEALGKQDSAYLFLKKYVSISESSDKTTSLIHSIMLHSDEKITEINQDTQKLRWRVWILILLSMSTCIIIIYSLVKLQKIKKENLVLVKKLIDNESSILQQEKQSQEELLNKKTIALALDFKKLMSQDHYFLQANITLPEIATLLNTNTSYLSKAINSYFKMNVSTYINKYKINHAVQLIKSGKAEHLTIEAIALECGFNNRIIFSKTFKKLTGISPSFLIKNKAKYAKKNLIDIE